MYSVADIDCARTILGVTEEASISDIRKTYRKVALETHPDKNSAEDATEKMQEVKLLQNQRSKTVGAAPVLYIFF